MEKPEWTFLASLMSCTLFSYFESVWFTRYDQQINIATLLLHPQFIQMYLFWPNIYSRIPSGHHIVFSHQVSRLLWAVPVSQNFLILDDLDSSGRGDSFGQAVCKTLLCWNLSNVCLMIRGMKITARMGHNFHHITSRPYTINMVSLSKQTLNTWLRSCLAGF